MAIEDYATYDEDIVLDEIESIQKRFNNLVDQLKLEASKGEEK